MIALRRTWESLNRFFFPLETDTWLACLRVGLGLQVIFYALSLRGDWREMFGPNANGLVGREIAEAILATDSVLAPRITWLTTAGGWAGLPEEVVLSVTWWLFVIAGVLLLIGLFSRGAATAAWFIHLCVIGSGELLLYGADNFTTIGLFYLMLAPLPDSYTLDARWRNIRRGDPQLLGLFRRVLQLHLCLVYFFGGLSKSLGGGWWNGASMWRALTRPPFNVIPPELLVSWRYLFPVAGIFICILEIGYLFFIWPKRTRLFWLTCMLGVHIGIAITMGMFLFSFVMIVLNVAAFGAGLFRLPSPVLRLIRNRLAVPGRI
jgi:hypothetical protein